MPLEAQSTCEFFDPLQCGFELLPLVLPPLIPQRVVKEPGIDRSIPLSTLNPARAERGFSEALRRE